VHKQTTLTRKRAPFINSLHNLLSIDQKDPNIINTLISSLTSSKARAQITAASAAREQITAASAARESKLNRKTLW